MDDDSTIEDQICEVLKTRLSIDLEESREWMYVGENASRTMTVRLLLDGEPISTDCFTFEEPPS